GAGPTGRIGLRGAAVGPQADRADLSAEKRSVGTETDRQVGAEAGLLLGPEDAPAREVAQAVGDEAAAVELRTPDDVRTVPDHQIGAGVDGCVGERLRITPVLPEAVLGPPGDRVGLRSLGAHVRVDDDEVGLLRRRTHDLTDVTEVGDPVESPIRREADQGHGGLPHPRHDDLVPVPDGVHALRAQNGPRLVDALPAEVVTVVVRLIEHVEAAQRRSGIRLAAEREAVVAPAALVDAGVRRDHLLQVAGDDVLGEPGAYLVEGRSPAIRRDSVRRVVQQDVPDGADAHLSRAGSVPVGDRGRPSGDRRCRAHGEADPQQCQHRDRGPPGDSARRAVDRGPPTRQIPQPGESVASGEPIEADARGDETRREHDREQEGRDQLHRLPRVGEHAHERGVGEREQRHVQEVDRQGPDAERLQAPPDQREAREDRGDRESHRHPEDGHGRPHPGNGLRARHAHDGVGGEVSEDQGPGECGSRPSGEATDARREVRASEEEEEVVEERSAVAHHVDQSGGHRHREHAGAHQQDAARQPVQALRDDEVQRERVEVPGVRRADRHPLHERGDAPRHERREVRECPHRGGVDEAPQQVQVEEADDAGTEHDGPRSGQRRGGEVPGQEQEQRHEERPDEVARETPGSREGDTEPPVDLQGALDVGKGGGVTMESSQQHSMLRRRMRNVA
ncbi:unnamed protein product, partial [Penicillium discolor]